MPQAFCIFYILDITDTVRALPDFPCEVDIRCDKRISRPKELREVSGLVYIPVPLPDTSTLRTGEQKISPFLPLPPVRTCVRHTRMRAERERGGPGGLYRGRPRGVLSGICPFCGGSVAGRSEITPPASGRASRRRSGSGREPEAAPEPPLPSSAIPQPSSAMRRPSRSWRPGSLRRTGSPLRRTS